MTYRTGHGSMIKRVGVALALVVASTLPARSTFAAAGDCSVTGNLCMSKTAYSGSVNGGSGDTYRFATSDPDLSNNTYSGGGAVANNVISARNRNSSFTRACAFNGTSYTGGMVWQVAYATIGFVAVANGAESFYYAGSTC